MRSSRSQNSTQKTDLGARASACGILIPLMLGYLLFYGVLFVESAYALPRLLKSGAGEFTAEWFRAEWFRACLEFGPLYWLADGPCQRIAHLSLAFFIPAVGLLGLGYLRLLRSVQRQPEAWSLSRLIGLAAVASLPLLLLLPPTSGDYVAYLFAGRVVSMYHQNPWLHPIAEFPSEHNYLSPAAWTPQLRCVYGPVWAAVMALTTGASQLVVPGKLTFTGLIFNVLVLRVANVGALVAAAVAVWRINGRLWPRQQRLVTAAFLLNPLLVYEGIGALHNDLWGVAFLLWGCYLFLQDDVRFLSLLALSFLTKYVILAMTPFAAIYYCRRRDWRQLGWLAATMLTTGTMMHLTGFHLTGYLAASQNRFYLSPTSFPQFAAMVITIARGLPFLSGTLVREMAHVMTAAFIPIYLVLIWKTRTREQVITHTLWALLLYFAGVYMQAVQWYYLWPLALLCATRWTRATVNLAWASCAVLLGYVMQLWNHLGISGYDARSVVPGFLLAIAAPALAYLAGQRGWWLVSAVPGPADGDVNGCGETAWRKWEERSEAGAAAPGQRSSPAAVSTAAAVRRKPSGM